MIPHLLPNVQLLFSKERQFDLLFSEFDLQQKVYGSVNMLCVCVCVCVCGVCVCVCVCVCVYVCVLK